MNEPVTQPALRPLGLGELLDRAVTLCVRFVVPFSLVYLVYGVPLAVVNYFASRGTASMIEAITDQLKAQASGQTPNPHAFTNALASAGSNGAWSVAIVLVAFFGSPLVSGALIDATSTAYLGRTPTFAGAYRTALRRWANLIGINVLYGLAAGALYFVVVIVAIVVVLAVVAISASAHAIGIAVGVAIGIVFGLAALALAFVVGLAYQISFFTCVVEHANFVMSFTRGLGRVFQGVGLQRSLVVGLAYVTVAIGIFLVSAVGEVVLVGLLHSAIAGAVFRTIVALGTAAFLTAFMAAFYFDLRVREEGLDLQLQAQAVLNRPVEVP